MDAANRTLLIAGIVISVFLIGGAVLYAIQPEEELHFREIFWGQLPGILNFVFGAATIRYARNKDDKNFMLIVLGAMTLIMLILAVFIIFSLYLLNFNQKYYILTVFIFYFLYLTFELIYLVQSEKKKPQNNVH
ncbi:MAG: hypothetical protein LC102_07635 [Ignavibacteriales bacterium]|mgnify:CR=1 FL=1|nr:hypothetical protein [Ignavibacteriaceae bacterium]MBW7873963.1 hypothetical protein [Ignavibacteria bacterium]MCZ2143278.1 hypothetical protein [Ignavibacteriales bacterium]OQY77243.1 MAG: hypothetical protein B6D45_02945 [Ignavibacteriales bacterium UTCHB3]WKZ72394.1 MAG: hypothetical protein QY308_12280 [Ignavibacteriaceae bacterium]